MEKKSKKGIIIGMTSLFLVTLVLLGLTYAYYRTRVVGNTTEKSISVTTKLLKLTYNDGSNGIIGGEQIEPSDTVYTKTFTVKNDSSEELEYAVYLIDVVNEFELKDDIKYTLTCSAECNGVEETTFPSGISQLVTNTIAAGATQTYTLTFTYKDSGEDQSVDMGKKLSAKIQIFVPEEDGSYMPYEKETLAYNIINNALTMKNGTAYRTTPLTAIGESSDTYTGQIIETNPRIISESELNVAGGSIYNFPDYNCGGTPSKVSSLSDAVGGNLRSMQTGVCYGLLKEYNEETGELTFVDAEEEVISEMTLSVAEDDYGTSYYFRGNVQDNYVNFANACWRIVRIAGDGSVKLIYEGEGNCNSDSYTATQNTYIVPFGSTTFGEATVMDYLMNDAPNITPTTSLRWANYYYLTTSLIMNTQNTYNKYLKEGGWCIANKAYTSTTGEEVLEVNNYQSKAYYDSYVRLNGNDPQPTLKCNGSILYRDYDMRSGFHTSDLYVGDLTADEAVYAGLKTINNFSAPKINTYLSGNGYTSDFWTLSPAVFNGNEDLVYVVKTNGMFYNQLNSSYNARHVISILSSVKATGEGTKDNPYELYI